MSEKLPGDVQSQIASFMSDDLQACDPRCHRASRTVQAAWRGWVTRFQRSRCTRCGERVFLGITLTECQSGRVYARITFAALPDHFTRRYMAQRMPFTCDTCRAVRHLYATAGDMDE